jgi:hypothetical protein
VIQFASEQHQNLLETHKKVPQTEKNLVLFELLAFDYEMVN